MKDFTTLLKETEEIGYVEEVVQSLVLVSGLPNSQPQEIIIFEDNSLGQVFSLSKDHVNVLMFSKNQIKVGMKATRTRETLQIPIHYEVLGHIMNPLGKIVDNTPLMNPPKASQQPIEVTPPNIKMRTRIAAPLDTGVALVDMMVPIGRGQRELVIGDRKTGKSNFLLKTVLTQAIQGTVCIYAAIGKKKMDIKRAQEFFVKHAVMNMVIIVASDSQDSSGMIYLTPYTAMSIAEYFRDQGRNVLVVLDDLSTHAKYYREISLLAKRFPGRNSYPGDIFYVHAKLLERAGNFTTPKGEASITCLPIVESIQGDLTGYIQTNIMSMTDGHIFFDSDLFAKGRRPAVNPFLSVTRVGRQTQTTLKKEVNRELNSFLTLYEKMQNFVHFGAELSDSIKLTLATGERILTFFDQSPFGVIPQKIQTVTFTLLWSGTWVDKDIPTMKKEMEYLIEIYKQNRELRKLVDELVEGSDTFNTLINNVRKLAPKILNYIKTPQTKGNNQVNQPIKPVASASQTPQVSSPTSPTTQQPVQQTKILPQSEEKNPQQPQISSQQENAPQTQSQTLEPSPKEVFDASQKKAN